MKGASGGLVVSNNLISLIVALHTSSIIWYHRLLHTPEIYDLKVFKAGEPSAGGSENLVWTKTFCM